MATLAKPPTRPNVRGAPEPLRGGPLALLRFLRSHGMLNHRYARLIARWAWLKLRWRGRLQTDGLCFVGPGVKFEIGKDASVHLGRNCWIGHDACVLRGVTVGDNCVIGTSSVVTKDLPANSVSAGLPARVLRMREEPERLRWS